MFLDLQKAFDTVQHDILLNKLFNYGLRGVVQKWFQLSDQRHQYTVIGKVNSSMVFVSSALGPLLFLIYIIDKKMLVVTQVSYYYLLTMQTFLKGTTNLNLSLK